MTEHRGLLTDREREALSQKADVTQHYVYQIRSRVRQKVERLATDMEILDERHTDLAEELRETVMSVTDSE